MTAALTLPGTIPGLLRRGSPVTLRPRVYGDVTLMHGAHGVVHDAARGVAVVDTFGGSPCVVRYGREDVALDLTDATGRAHAAWWLEDQEDSAVEVALLAVYGHPVNLDLWLSALMSAVPVSDEAIERTRLVCLHVAGVQP